MGPPDFDRARRVEIVARRIGLVRDLLERRSAGGLLLDSRRDFAWLTLGGLNHVVLAGEKGAAPLLVTRDAVVVLAPTNEAPRIADEEVVGLPIEVAALPWWEAGAAEEAASRWAGGRAVLRVDEVGGELEEMRTLLSPAERARMEWLAREMRLAIDELPPLRGGETEDEVAANVVAGLGRRGVRAPVVLAAADDRIERYRHPLPTSARVGRRLMLVLVAERWGLHVAHTELWELAERSDDLARRATALTDVLAAMREATTAGGTLGGVLETARSAYARHGMDDEWTLHHQGGTIGYAGRERIAVPGDETSIRPGMAFAWNPSARGLKLEETLYLDDEGRRHSLTGPVASG